MIDIEFPFAQVFDKKVGLSSNAGTFFIESSNLIIKATERLGQPFWKDTP